MGVTVNFHMQVNATSCHSKLEVHRIMTEQLFNALKAIETFALGTMRFMDCPRAMQGLALRQSINLIKFIVPSAKVTIA